MWTHKTSPCVPCAKRITSNIMITEVKNSQQCGQQVTTEITKDVPKNQPGIYNQYNRSFGSLLIYWFTDIYIYTYMILDDMIYWYTDILILSWLSWSVSASSRTTHNTACTALTEIKIRLDVGMSHQSLFPSMIESLIHGISFKLETSTTRQSTVYSLQWNPIILRQCVSTTGIFS